MLPIFIIERSANCQLGVSENKNCHSFPSTYSAPRFRIPHKGLFHFKSSPLPHCSQGETGLSEEICPEKPLFL